MGENEKPRMVRIINERHFLYGFTAAVIEPDGDKTKLRLCRSNGTPGCILLSVPTIYLEDMK